MHFADTLIDAIWRCRTPLCLGLDPRWDLLPAQIRRRYPQTEVGRARAYEEFCLRVLGLAEGHVAIVKPQLAFFEACGPKGMTVLRQVVGAAHRRNFLVVLDAKRGDIASTAEAYADALYNVYQADAITVHPYLGRDSLEPFIDYARKTGRGVFILVRTSNPGSNDYQNLDCGSAKLYEHIARHVQGWAQETAGRSGFGLVGAVVGATQAPVLATLRQHMPSALFLLPGYGAQGAKAASLAPAFTGQGKGAIVNAARSILYAPPPEAEDWEAHVFQALLQAKTELAAVAGF
ncbi:Orotidine 5'-phosphate decarboxylase [bacterium HR36]|nr:Orotidine 5'-phosphate decarboxylase [bacterium HR36]